MEVIANNPVESAFRSLHKDVGTQGGLNQPIKEAVKDGVESEKKRKIRRKQRQCHRGHQLKPEIENYLETKPIWRDILLLKWKTR